MEAAVAFFDDRAPDASHASSLDRASRSLGSLCEAAHAMPHGELDLGAALGVRARRRMVPAKPSAGPDWREAGSAQASEVWWRI